MTISSIYQTLMLKKADFCAELGLVYFLIFNLVLISILFIDSVFLFN